VDINATPASITEAKWFTDALIIAFVQGAQWWEWNKQKATMWASDRDLAENEARARLKNATLGKSPNQ